MASEVVDIAALDLAAVGALFFLIGPIAEARMGMQERATMTSKHCHSNWCIDAKGLGGKRRNRHSGNMSSSHDYGNNSCRQNRVAKPNFP